MRSASSAFGRCSGDRGSEGRRETVLGEAAAAGALAGGLEMCGRDGIGGVGAGHGTGCGETSSDATDTPTARPGYGRARAGPGRMPRPPANDQPRAPKAAPRTSRRTWGWVPDGGQRVGSGHSVSNPDRTARRRLAGQRPAPDPTASGRARAALPRGRLQRTSNVPSSANASKDARNTLQLTSRQSFTSLRRAPREPSRRALGHGAARGIAHSPRAGVRSRTPRTGRTRGSPRARAALRGHRPPFAEGRGGAMLGAP